MRTRLTEILHVEYPVMLAGMGGVSYHRLVAAVSEAGGFGCLGASTMGPEQMVEEITATAALTDKPFGVDLLTAAPQDMAAKVADMIEGGATVFVAGLGVPREVVEQWDSMIEAHIADGDFVVIRQQDSARDGDIVVAQVEENAVTLKRFFREKDRVRLQPANASYPPQFYPSVRIQGKLIGVIRRLD